MLARVLRRARALETLELAGNPLTDAPLLAAVLEANPRPATHAIWPQLKAGDLILTVYRVYKTLLDTI